MLPLVSQAAHAPGVNIGIKASSGTFRVNSTIHQQKGGKTWTETEEDFSKLQGQLP
jgi:hypothetical protein